MPYCAYVEGAGPLEVLWLVQLYIFKCLCGGCGTTLGAVAGATVYCDVPMWRVGDHSIGAVACATVDGTTLGAVTGATVDCDVPIRRVRDHSRCCGWCNCTYIDTCLCGGCGTTL